MEEDILHVSLYSLEMDESDSYLVHLIKERERFFSSLRIIMFTQVNKMRERDRERLRLTDFGSCESEYDASPTLRTPTRPWNNVFMRYGCLCCPLQSWLWYKILM